MAFSDSLDDVLRKLLDPDLGHAESVTRQVCGDPNETDTLNALFEPQEPQRDQDRLGDRVEHTGILEVSSAQAVDETDLWVIGGDCWQTERIERPVGGLRALYVRRTEKIRSKRSRVRA